VGEERRWMAYSLGVRGLKIRGKLSAVVTLAALVSVLGGCGGGGGKAADGPLSSGLSIHDPIPRGGICAPGGRAWAFGFQLFTNYGKTTVVPGRREFGKDDLGLLDRMVSVVLAGLLTAPVASG
jgi:hypothetical protein